MAKLLSGTRIYGTANVDSTLYVNGTTASTSTTTGALVVAGGVGIGGALYVPTVYAQSNTFIGQNYDQGTGVLQVTGQSTFNGAVTDKSLNLQGGNNLLTYSNDLSNAIWLKATGCTVTTNSTTAPDGTTTSNAISQTTNGNTNGVYRALALFQSGRTLSLYLKAGEITSVTSQNGAGQSWTFDLTAGTFSSVNAVYTTSATSVGNGWWRVQIVFGSVAGTDFYIGATSGASASNKFYLWGAQLEIGTVASAYTPTTTAAITTTNNISVPSGQVLNSLGTISLPSYSFATYPAQGFYSPAQYEITYAAGTVNQWTYNGSGQFVLRNTSPYSWSSTSDSRGTIDLTLYRDAANTLAQRNSTNAQTFRLYNTYTDASNYERLGLTWSGNSVTIGTEYAGTGATRNLSFNGYQLIFQTSGTNRWLLNYNAHFIPTVDASYDLGIASTNRIRNAYFSGVVNTTDVAASGNIYSTAVFANNSIAVTANTIINYADPVGTALAMAIALG